MALIVTLYFEEDDLNDHVYLPSYPDRITVTQVDELLRSVDPPEFLMRYEIREMPWEKNDAES